MKKHIYKDGSEMISTDRGAFENQGDPDYEKTVEATDEDIQNYTNVVTHENNRLKNLLKDCKELLDNFEGEDYDIVKRQIGTVLKK